MHTVLRFREKSGAEPHGSHGSFPRTVKTKKFRVGDALTTGEGENKLVEKGAKKTHTQGIRNFNVSSIDALNRRL